MARQYNSFLVRVWSQYDEYRVEVEHVQSGARVQLTSFLMAMVWLASHCGNPSAGASMLMPPAEEAPTVKTQRAS